MEHYLTKADRYRRERQEVDRLVGAVGWLRILKALTPLTRAIDGYENRKGKIGTHQNCDVAPCHSSKSGRKFYLLPDADVKGVGYCYVCEEAVDPYDIIARFRNVDFGEAYRLVKDYVGYNGSAAGTTPADDCAYVRDTVEYAPKSDAELKSEADSRSWMYSLWGEAYSLNDPASELARAYFRHRGMNLPVSTILDDSIRFHPGVNYYKSIPSAKDVHEATEEFHALRKQTIEWCKASPYFQGFRKRGEDIVGAYMGKHPAILTMLRGPEMEPRRVAKLYLNVDGAKLDLPNKAHFPVKKLVFAPGDSESIVNAAIYIDPPGSVVMIGEGLETTCVMRSYVKLPSASTFNTGGMSKFIAQPQTRLIFALVDKDRSHGGTKAVYKLMCAYRDSDVIVVPVFIPCPIPDDAAKGIDWADVLNAANGEQWIPEFLLSPSQDWDWQGISNKYFAQLKAMDDGGYFKNK